MTFSRTLLRLFAGIALLTVSLPATETRTAAPAFTLTDSKGASVSLSQYRGRVVLLDFWATWCHGCKVEIPWYMQFGKKYKHDGLTVLGVSMDENWKLVKPFLKEKKMKYPVVLGNDEVAKRYGLSAMPMTLLIDRDGNIASSFTGIVDKDKFENEIRLLLQAK